MITHTYIYCKYIYIVPKSMVQKDEGSNFGQVRAHLHRSLDILDLHVPSKPSNRMDLT